MSASFLVSDAHLGLVGLDLDALGEELGDPVPLLGLLAELAEAREGVEVLEVGLADDLERADGVLRVVELLVEPREARGDLAALGRVGDELQLALERVGRGAGVVARLLQVGDRLQRRTAGRVEVGQDPLVASDRRVDVADALGEELGLAQRDARLARRLSTAMLPRRRRSVVASV